VAILGVSRSRSSQRIVDGQKEERTILPLALSYDHRAVDGADAARFLKWVVDALEHPLLLNFQDPSNYAAGGSDD
jgi:pyruvate dehydrogenase E2 component (dihydrolipoamide acetyltransferase)